jgi:hypothetical protein
VSVRIVPWLAVSSALLLARAAAAQPPPAEDTPRFESSVDVEGELTAEPTASGIATRMAADAKDLPLSVPVSGARSSTSREPRPRRRSLNGSGVNVGTGFGVLTSS